MPSHFFGLRPASYAVHLNAPRLVAEAGGRDELRIELAHGDGPQRVGDGDLAAERGKHGRELGGGQRILWPERLGRRSHEPRIDDRRDLRRGP